MTVPSAKIGVIEIVVCPNCGGHTMDERWVDKYSRPKSHEVSMNEAIASRELPPAYPFSMSCGDYIPIRIQLIMTCKKCGYTLVRNLDSIEGKSIEHNR